MNDREDRRPLLTHERIRRDVRKSVHMHSLLLSVPCILLVLFAAVTPRLLGRRDPIITAILWAIVLLPACFTVALLVSDARDLLAVKSRKYIITEDTLLDGERVAYYSHRPVAWHSLSFTRSGTHRVRSDVFDTYLDLTVEGTYYLVGVPRKNGRLHLLYIYDTKNYKQDQI
ncbi:MAG: hypothetical protein J6R04_03265 [Clostridia bacterium]|nr:hypothetical protein [Clostridia bacterium]